jgi:hypothetical protein
MTNLDMLYGRPRQLAAALRQIVLDPDVGEARSQRLPSGILRAFSSLTALRRISRTSSSVLRP